MRHYMRHYTDGPRFNIFPTSLSHFSYVGCQLKLPSLIKGRPSTTNNNNNNKAKCIPGGTLRVLAGKKLKSALARAGQNVMFVCLLQCVPQGRVYLRIILAQYLQSSDNNSFHTIRAPARFEPESTRDPTATHRLTS
jgi:hypothetical protein